MMDRRLRCAALAAAAVAALALSGCAAAGLRPLRAIEGEFATEITEEELAERLDRFAEMYAQTISEGVRALTEGESDPARQREALVWQIQSIRTCRNVVLAPDPQAAFTDLWVLCVQQRAYLTSPPVVERLGPKGGPLVAAARTLEAEIAVIGAGFLQPAELGKARQDVESFAQAFPIRDGFARAAPLPSTAGSSSGGALSWVTSVPMAPFRFVTGIDEGAAAVRHFAAVADRFARRIDSLPQETLWEAQLLLFDLEQRPTVQRSLASIESAARTGESIAATAQEFQGTADRLTTTVQSLPADVRKELDAALAALDTRQSELRTTISEVRKALADAHDLAEQSAAVVRDAQSAGAGFDRTAKSVGEAARSLEAAVQAYQSMMREIHPHDPHAPPPDPNKKPFDILDWQRTADSIGTAAAELRGALAEFRSVAADNAVHDRALATARAVRAEADATIDRAFLRALELAGAIAVLVVGVRFLRPGRGAADGPPGGA